ncbi:DUF726 domain-containing protein [Stenotrophomonas sp.]|uniref:DUF726 domain-containing protein n=1 Tax=Stenotrophomonas sp. TaxID=69392 RepID=UPI0028AF9D2E|nr:DUF726 domain-containing protein [Stenotrophomonas sp.]
MPDDLINQLLKAAQEIPFSMPAAKARFSSFRFRTPHAPTDDRHTVVEASIFIHGYSAGHDAEDRDNLLRIIPASTQLHTNIFAFWNSSHFSRFNRRSQQLLSTSANFGLLSSVAVAAGDRMAHFSKIRDRAENMGRILFAELERYLARNYPNVRTVNLIGHSLGGRLIISSLRSLTEPHSGLKINDVLLMAAAVEINPSEAESIRRLVQGRLINAYSTDDWTLLLPVDEECLGRREVKHFENIRIDGFGHSDYWKKLQEVFFHTSFGSQRPSSPGPQPPRPSAGIESKSINDTIDKDAMELNIESPSEIYQHINSELILIMEALNNPSDDAALDKAQADALENIQQHQAALHALLVELEENAEWNTFTIAFYGETGAGKSTLIETLRIILQEPGKIASQQAFLKLRESHELNEERSLQLQKAIEQTATHADELMRQLNASLQLHEQSCVIAQQALDQSELHNAEQIKELEDAFRQSEQRHANVQAATTHLQVLVNEHKTTLSFWKKILGLFQKSPVVIELAQAQSVLLSAIANRDHASSALNSGREHANQQRQTFAQRLSEATSARNDASAVIREQRFESEKKKLVLSQQREQIISQNAELLTELEQLADGYIIGDGRPDFTRQTQRYELQLGGQPFSLLDVPGIEGKEGLVLGEIEQAVQKAHAVFYVTNQAAPPQTGEDNEKRKGTLEKIKDHLGSQTEVWTIFNKKITNPKLALTDRPLISSDEKTSLIALDDKMREHLGEHYRSNVPLTALPAFLASTDHLLPDSQHARRRDKMLADFDSADVLRKSGLQDFMHLLESALLNDANAKITRANFNKARLALDQTTNAIERVHLSLADLSQKLDQEGSSAANQLGSSFLAFRQRLNACGETMIEKLSSTVRNETYALIDGDISDSHFENALKERIESGLGELGKNLPKSLREEAEIFQKDVRAIIHRFEDHANELTGIYTQFDNTRLDGNFEFKIDIDSGINFWGLASGFIGLALAPFTGGASLWITGISVASLVASVGKAAWKFFSTDFKKSQQRKATDDNLRSACERLRDSLLTGLNETLPEMENIIHQIRQGLEAPAKHASAQAHTLDQSARKMKSLSLKIAKAGNY